MFFLEYSKKSGWVWANSSEAELLCFGMMALPGLGKDLRGPGARMIAGE